MKPAPTPDAAVGRPPVACAGLSRALLMAVLIPGAACAGMENCRIIDYPDHVEAVCSGTPVPERYLPQRYVPEQQEAAQQTSSEQNPAVAANDAYRSRRYQRLQQIREMGGQRKNGEIRREK